MSRMRPYGLAALAAFAALAAGCASDPAGPASGNGTPSSSDGSSSRDGDSGTGGGASREDPKRAFVYKRITTMTRRWAALGAEPGDAARAERAALESAIAGEVVRDLDAVLAEARRGDNPRFRRAAVRGLGFVAARQDEILEVLHAILDSNDVRLVTDALVSLARHGHRDTDVDRVANRLQSLDPVVRSNAALCLARVFRARRRLGLNPVNPEEASVMEALLMTALFDPGDAFVRGHAAQALGALGSPASEGALLNGLRDRDSFVRLSSAVALGSVGSRRAVPPLLDSLGRADDENEKNALALSLGRIAERDGSSPPLADLGTDAARWREWFER